MPSLDLHHSNVVKQKNTQPLKIKSTREWNSRLKTSILPADEMGSVISVTLIDQQFNFTEMLPLVVLLNQLIVHVWENSTVG